MKPTSYSTFHLLFLLIVVNLTACGNRYYLVTQSDIIRYAQEQTRIAAALEVETRFPEAIQHLELAVSLTPGESGIQNDIQRLRDLNRRHSEIHLSIGTNHLKQGRLSTARKELVRALYYDPKNTLARKYLSELDENHAVVLQTHNLERLKQLYAKKTPTHEDSTQNDQATLYLNMARRLLQNNDFQGAIREARKFLSARPDDKDAKIVLKQAYLELANTLIGQDRNDLSKASQHYLEAQLIPLEYEPLDRRQQELAEKLSNRYYRLGLKAYRKDMKQAISDWERALSIFPGHTNAALKLGHAKQIYKRLHQIAGDS